MIGWHHIYLTRNSVRYFTFTISLLDVPPVVNSIGKVSLKRMLFVVTQVVVGSSGSILSLLGAISASVCV